MAINLPDDLDNLMLQEHLLQLNHVLFKGNRIYRHWLLHINYTTYNLQCESDSINTHDHRDIMLLSNSDIDDHLFSYAWVLGIFHANILYTRPRSKDFQSCWIEFLWVQWFKVLQHCVSAWEQHTLNTIRFLPMADKDAFGFVDPANVLRGCHIIPSFADGRLHPDNVATSHCAGDSDNWKWYYINRWAVLVDLSDLVLFTRFVDHDMLICYHWGLGIGHPYLHTMALIQSRFHSIFQPPQANKLDTVNNEDLAEITQTEKLDLDANFELEGSEPDSEFQSESESILGDHIDMYGWSLDAGSGYYQF